MIKRKLETANLIAVDEPTSTTLLIVRNIHNNKQFGYIIERDKKHIFQQTLTHRLETPDEMISYWEEVKTIIEYLNNYKN